MSNKLTITADVPGLLAKLRDNREAHAAIVVEAREGYIESAKVALSEKLAKLRTGDLVSLIFSLSPPQDYTKEYDTAIRMLEWTTDKTIELSASDFRRFVEDEWDWMEHFLISNAPYSGTAAKLS